VAIVMAALALLAAAVALWPDPGRLPLVRARALGWQAPRAGRPRARGVPAGPLRRWLIASAAAVPVGLLLDGILGACAAAAVLVGTERVLRRSEDSGRTSDARLLESLPIACDLLAVCLAAGLPLPGALAAVAGSVSGDLRNALERVAGMTRLGADAGSAWHDAPAVLEPLARTLRRSEASGARAAPALQALAAELRTSARGAADVAVRRAGVSILAPLGLCFLPAFVCLGIAPLVIGIAGDVLG
jgi:pilus assembly protein TadC